MMRLLSFGVLFQGAGVLSAPHCSTNFISRFQITTKCPLFSSSSRYFNTVMNMNRGLKTYSAIGIGTGVKSTVQVSKHQVTTDLPRLLGGHDQSAQPVELLLSALIGCETATAAYVSRKMKPRLDIERLRFEYFAERDDLGSLQLPIDKDPDVDSKLKRIYGSVNVKVKDGLIKDGSRLELLKNQVDKRCPIASMIKQSGCIMDVEWKFIDE